MGKDIAELQRARRHLPVADAAIQPVLRGLAESFRQRLSGRHGERPAALLTHIDRALQSVCATPDSGQAARERAVVALVGIRRAFFPDAQAYRPLMAVQEG